MAFSFSGFNLCSSYDEFIDEKPVWIAKLSNGFTIYQDDDRPGEEIPSAWLRLKLYCETSKISIESLHLRFRSNIIEPLPQKAHGYFFCHKIVQFISAKNKEPFRFMVVGAVENEIIHTRIYKVPELHLVEMSTRELDKYKEFVIMRS